MSLQTATPSVATPAPAVGAAAATTALREFLAFKLGAEEYGIDIPRVQQIRSYEEPTRIANAPTLKDNLTHIVGGVRSNAEGVATASAQIAQGNQDLSQRTEEQASASMTEVVSSIKRVTDIMGEISAASAEQSAGVAQVGEAITQMDQVTQQNAALVEESAAAAESLKRQTQQLVSAVSVFKLGHGEAAYTSAAVPSYSSAERRSPERAKNVTRPKFGAKSNPKAKADAPTLTANAAEATPAQDRHRR